MSGLVAPLLFVCAAALVTLTRNRTCKAAPSFVDLRFRMKGLVLDLPAANDLPGSIRRSAIFDQVLGRLTIRSGLRCATEPLFQSRATGYVLRRQMVRNTCSRMIADHWSRVLTQRRSWFANVAFIGQKPIGPRITPRSTPASRPCVTETSFAVAWRIAGWR